MLSTRAEPLGTGAIKTHVQWNGAGVTLIEAFALLRDDAAFRSGLIAALRDAPFDGYFFETPAVNVECDPPFEYVLIDAPTFAHVAAEPHAFAEHFDRGTHGVVVFENLGRDATLIVPCPLDARAEYAHLAGFVRTAPPAQIDALFERVGAKATARLSEEIQWVSTAGMGVYWLHVRIDSRPKYYRHGPYTVDPRS